MAATASVSGSSSTSAAAQRSSLRLRGPDEPLAEAPIGIVPIIWNNADLPDLAAPVPATEVLDEVQRLGFQGTQLGTGFPAGAALARELAARELRLAEVYAIIPCGPDGPGPEALTGARARLSELHAAAGELLVVALERSDDRDAWLGGTELAPGLTDEGWRALGAALDLLAAEAKELGHPIAFHNHGGTYVETPAEVDRLLAVTDPDQVGLCLDTGHAILGGGAPEAILAHHRRRVTHVHLKDVAAEPLRALREGRINGFAGALRERIFAPLGSGLLDLPAVLTILSKGDYRGWLMVEQDTSWEPPSEAAAIGRRVLDATLRWLPAARAGGAD